LKVLFKRVAKLYDRGKMLHDEERREKNDRGMAVKRNRKK